MNINCFTQTAQEAAIAAQDLAARNGQAEIGTLHLLKALLDRPQGLVPQLAECLGLDPATNAPRCLLDLRPSTV